MTEFIENHEEITRYYFNLKNFRADNTIKHNEFMPPKTGRMSVYRTCELTDNEIWDIGSEYVEPERQKPIIGRGDLKAYEIFQEDLTIKSSKEPHPRHANVEGWSLDNEKDRLKAMKLAAIARSIKL